MSEVIKVIFREDNTEGFADSGEVIVFYPEVEANPGCILCVPIGRDREGRLYFCGCHDEMPMEYMTKYKIIHKTDSRVQEYLDFLNQNDTDGNTYIAVEKVMQHPPTYY